MSIFESGSKSRRRLKPGLAAAGLFLVGGVAGGAFSRAVHPPIAMAPLHNVTIRNLATSDGIVAIRGRIAERFGSRMVIDDGTGRALVDTGPHGDAQTSLPTGAVVTVQGRYEREAFHPSFIVMPSGAVMPLGPMAGPHFGGHRFQGPHEDDNCGPPPMSDAVPTKPAA